MKNATVTQTGFMATNIINGTTPVNTYQPTTIDEKKKVSNRLVSICGPWYEVITAEGNRLSFKGRRAFDAWAKNNDYVTDF